jgi:4-hydroxy-4-methyl-2-oxoglutarate aldolase
LILQKAIEVAGTGDVIVAEVGGDIEAGVWGEIMTFAAQTRGIAGLVINGAVRDAKGIRELGFPVFAAGISMKGTGKDHLGYINHPISCAGVVVNPGDVVLGDDDGVVIIPQAESTGLIEICKRREVREQEWKQAIRSGKITMDLQNLGPLFQEKGLVER